MLELDGNTGVSLLQDNTVSTGKIVDSAVTAAKLATAAIGAAAPQRMMLTAAKSASGTAVDFSPADGTGIPSWAKKVTIQFGGVSTSGTSNLLVQLGAGAVQTTSYAAGGATVDGTVSNSAFTTGFGIRSGTAANSQRGAMVLTQLAGNTWVATHQLIGGTTTQQTYSGAGDVTLSGVLDRIRITTVNGTDTFDAGSVSLLIEG